MMGLIMLIGISYCMSTWNWSIRCQTGGSLSRKCLAMEHLVKLLNAGIQKPTTMLL
uniref:Uncharacterized protein n=1 Tax=Arundo donax TaxID=35708 RepID=A0A0A9DR04_ARUDO